MAELAKWLNYPDLPYIMWNYVPNIIINLTWSCLYFTISKLKKTLHADGAFVVKTCSRSRIKSISTFFVRLCTHTHTHTHTHYTSKQIEIGARKGKICDTYRARLCPHNNAVRRRPVKRSTLIKRDGKIAQHVARELKQTRACEWRASLSLSFRTMRRARDENALRIFEFIGAWE